MEINHQKFEGLYPGSIANFVTSARRSGSPASAFGRKAPTNLFDFVFPFLPGFAPTSKVQTFGGSFICGFEKPGGVIVSTQLDWENDCVRKKGLSHAGTVELRSVGTERDRRVDEIGASRGGLSLVREDRIGRDRRVKI